MNRTWKDYTVLFFSLLLAFFSFYTGGLGALVPPTQRGIHVLLIFPVVLFMKDSKVFSGVMEDAFNIFLAVLSCVAFGYYVLNWERLYSEPSLSAVDMAMGVIGILIVLEVTRRTVGLGITGIIIAFILYAIFGRQVPHDFLAHQGFTPEQVVYLVFYGTEGIFSVPVGVCATFIVMIVISSVGLSEFSLTDSLGLLSPSKKPPLSITKMLEVI